MTTNRKNPLCPICSREAGWDWQDDYVIEGRYFIERALICLDGCDWRGPACLFESRVPSCNQRLLGHGRPLPADPFDDAVPMVGPTGEEKP
jgi:hypothetical protein